MNIIYLNDIAQVYCYILHYYLQQSNYNVPSIYSDLYPSPLPTTAFLYELFSKLNCSLEVYIISLLYLQRVIESNPTLLNAQSLLALVLSSIIVAQKYHEEICYKIYFYSTVTTLSIPDLCALESDFLQQLHFALYVSPEKYMDFYNSISAFSKKWNPALQLPVIIPSTSSQGALFDYSYLVVNQFLVSPIVPIPLPILKIPAHSCCILQNPPPYTLHPQINEESLYYNEGLQWKYYLPVSVPNIQTFMTIPILNYCGIVYKCNQTYRRI